MTKEEWKKIKDEAISYEALFDYYTEHGGKLKTLDEFVRVFNQLDGKMVTNSQGSIVLIDVENSKEKVRNYFNEKFKD